MPRPRRDAANGPMAMDMYGSAFPRDGPACTPDRQALIKVLIADILAAACGPVPSAPVLMDVWDGGRLQGSSQKPPGWPQRLHSPGFRHP